jgi:hypothetical protein
MGLKLNGFLAYADDVNLLGDDVRVGTVKKNTNFK